MRAGFLVVDKPAGITSHDAVAIFRAVTGAKKVGHTGTLDPFATGVLPLAFGPATRLISFLDEDHKTYDATISLGAATDTGDPTGQVVREQPVPALDRAGVETALKGFIGVLMHAPPAYSAVKHKGRPLYAWAREGRPVQAAPRPTRIDSIDLLDLGPTTLRVLIKCGRGTYARVLADEIAQALGTSGHLGALRRTRSGPFEEAAAMTLGELARIAGGSEDWERVLRPSRDETRVKWAPRDEVWAGLASRFVSPAEALSHLPRAALLPGDRIEPGHRPMQPPPGVAVGGLYLAMQGADLVAVMRREPPGGQVVRLMSGQ